MSYKYMDILSSTRHMRKVRDKIYMAHLVTKDIPRLKALDIVKRLDGLYVSLSLSLNFFYLWVQNMYAQLLPLALPAPPMPGMGGGYGPPPPMGAMGMPPMPGYGMPPMGSY